MHRFFVEPSQIGEKEIVITGPDVNHIRNVLRMRAGEEPVQPEPLRETALRTGDAVLDALLASGAVQAEPAEDALVLHCAFATDRPFALAPAFVLCTVEEGVARLRWTKKDAADGAASNAHTD